MAPVDSANELEIPVAGATLFARDVGSGPPIVVLHGGPDLDQEYLFPDLRDLAGSFRIVAYDQRGRGRSAIAAHSGDAEQAALHTDIADLADVCSFVSSEPVTLLGHSWGALLALEFALAHPEAVRALVLVDPAPISLEQIASSRAAWFASPEAIARERALRNADEFKQADPDAVAARYAEYYRGAVAKPAHLAELVGRLRHGFTRQGSAGIRIAREVEQRLFDETWRMPGFDLLPDVARIAAPMLVLAGARDPAILAAEQIAAAAPGARLRIIYGVGHFPLLEARAESTGEIATFLASGIE